MIRRAAPTFALGWVLWGSSAHAEEKPAPKAPASTTSSASTTGATPAVPPASSTDAPAAPAATEQPEGTSASAEAGPVAATTESKGKPPRVVSPHDVLPPLDPNAQSDYVAENTTPRTPNRFVELGFLFGSVIRPSGKESIHYQTGYLLGASARLELAPWMGVRLTYREEHVPVKVDAGGFDYQDYHYKYDFTQPDLEIITIGARFEPTWIVHPRFRVFGILGIGWVRMDAPVPTAPGFSLQGKRSATEVNVPIGAGVAYEIIPNWLNCSVSFTYGFAFDQHGTAYEPLQAIVDGKIVYLAPLPVLQSVGDLNFTIGVIL